MATYDALRNKQTELIRKAKDGSVFVGAATVEPIEELTEYHAAVTGPPAVPAYRDLKALPVGMDDLGWLTSDGAQFSRDVAQSEVTSWGSVSPTRTDITSDTSTMTVSAQETKLLTIGLATGVDLATIVAAADTGEVSIAKPSTPKSKTYRVLSLAVDQGDAGEIYVARFLPRAKVTNYSEQSFNGGDEAILWGVTFTGEEDSELGYSERWIFGGDGWYALLDDMGIDELP